MLSFLVYTLLAVSSSFTVSAGPSRAKHHNLGRRHQRQSNRLAASSTATTTTTSSSSPRPDAHNLQRRLSSTANLTVLAQSHSPAAIRGVNLGAWFVIEPYMIQDEWKSMGGSDLDCDCSADGCVLDEFKLTKKLGQQKANAAFQKHWSTFITQDDVNLIKKYGLNSVRIPIGFWIIESAVNSNECYPQGGLDALRKGAKMFNDAGISILLDLHAAPGAQTASNSFTGRCVDTPQFWQKQNTDRMLDVGAELAKIIHQEPENFGSVWGIEALNEPPTDGAETPGYFEYLQDFITRVRQTEDSLNVTTAERLSTAMMDVSWQQKNTVNGAYAANGGNAYDTHLYFNFGAPCGSQGCVQKNLESHVEFACQGAGGRIQSNKAQHNDPTFLGEFWLEPLNGAFDFYDKKSVQKFGDAQKRGFSPEGGHGGTGWYFWSWKMTNADTDGRNHLRSYKDAVEQGYMTDDASTYFNHNLC